MNPRKRSSKVLDAIFPVVAIIDYFANINILFCERFWCFWLGGFEELAVSLIKAGQMMTLKCELKARLRRHSGRALDRKRAHHRPPQRHAGS
jgi:hypothetical protein